MGKILCATRGGEATYRTQDGAIELAEERDETLLFLHLVDLPFVDRTVDADVVNTEQKLTEMGRPELLSAKERAAEQGVAAEAIIRTGEMCKEAENTPRKEGVSLVVLGQPAGEESVFEVADLEAIADEIEDEMSVEACIV